MKINKNLTINGTSNNGVRHRYSFEKDSNFKKGFIEFMSSLKFDKETIERYFIYEEDGENGECVKKIITPMEVEDRCWFFENEKYEIDVFWGKTKVIMLIRTNQKRKRDRRRKMLNELEKRSGWISEDQKEKRSKKNRLKQVQSQKKK